MNIRQLLWWWGPVLVLCGLIFWLSATPNLKVGNDGTSDFLLRKTAHMVVYGLLFLATYRALIKGELSRWRIQTVIWTALLVLIYAISDEVHQYFVPTRSGMLSDLVFDMAGVGIALAGVAWWGWWNKALHEAEFYSKSNVKVQNSKPRVKD